MKQFSIWDFAKYKGFPFSINIGVHLDEVETHVHPHVHSYTELAIILDGTAVHVVDGHTYPLKAGDVFVIKGDTYHSFRELHAMKHCNIMFDPQHFLDGETGLKQMPGYQALFMVEPYYRKEHRFESKLVLDPARLHFVEDMIHLMLDEYNALRAGSQAVVKTYFASLAAYLSRQYSSHDNPAMEKLLRLSKAVAYMETNFTEPICLDDVAAIAYLSVRHFSRVFKEIYSVPPMEYIISLRLKHACVLLQDSDTTVSEVALNVGFSNISFFSRCFKERLGLSPRDYRRQTSRYAK